MLQLAVVPGGTASCNSSLGGLQSENNGDSSCRVGSTRFLSKQRAHWCDELSLVGGAVLTARVFPANTKKKRNLETKKEA